MNGPKIEIDWSKLPTDLSKFTKDLREIITEIQNEAPKDNNGKLLPTSNQKQRFVSAILKEVSDPIKLMNEVENAPKDKHGMPILPDLQAQYFLLMIIAGVLMNDPKS